MKREWKKSSEEEIIKDYPILKDFFDNINRWSKYQGNRTVVRRYNDGTYAIKLCSEKHEYCISVHNDYIGCVYNCRYRKPLEDWHRGNDLKDGKLNTETIDGILWDILRTELIPIKEISTQAPLAEEDVSAINWVQSGLLDGIDDEQALERVKSLYNGIFDTTEGDYDDNYEKLSSRPVLYAIARSVLYNNNDIPCVKRDVSYEEFEDTLKLLTIQDACDIATTIIPEAEMPAFPALKWFFADSADESVWSVVSNDSLMSLEEWTEKKKDTRYQGIDIECEFAALVAMVLKKILNERTK